MISFLTHKKGYYFIYRFAQNQETASLQLHNRRTEQCLSTLLPHRLPHTSGHVV